MIPKDDIARRLQQVRSELVARNVDLAIITRPQNIFYLTNYRAAGIAAATSRLHALVVPAEGEATLMVRSLERRTASAMTSVKSVTYDDDADPFDVLADMIALDRTSALVGMELQQVSAFQHQEIASRLGARVSDVSYQDVSGLVEDLRLQLEPKEIEHMVAAAAVTEAGLQAGLDRVRPGASAGSVIGAVHEAMYEVGQSDFEKSFVAMWSGPDGGHMHDTQVARTLEEGDVATVEVMGVDNHYYACAQATVRVGASTVPDFDDHQRLVHAMHDAARAVVRHGVKAEEVFEAASAVYREATGSSYFRRVGGSMGLTAFTLDLVPGNKSILRRGMPILIQTLVNDPVLIACASTVLVTDDGCQALTRRRGEPPVEHTP